MKSPPRMLSGLWLLLFGLVAGIAIWRYSNELWSQLNRPLNFPVPGLVVLLMLQLGFWGMLAFGWKRLLDTVGARNTPLSICFWQQMLVMLGKYVPGKIWGMLARGGEMARGGDRLLNVVSVTYLEQLLLLHSGAVIAALLLPLLFPSAWAIVTAMAVGLSVPLAVYFHDAGLGLIRHLARRFGRPIDEPAPIRMDAGRYFVLMGVYGSLWLISGLMFVSLYLILIDRHVAPDLLLALMLSNIAGIAAGFAALFAPGGIGVREGVTIGILLPYMPVEHAMLLAIVSRLWQVASDVAGGVLGLWLARHTRPTRPGP